jgi:threonine/homoserine/homoserine lactone efflux protein
MKKMFILFLAVFFPWFVFLINDNPAGALLSLVLQVTVIGWPFTTIWAYRTHYPAKKKHQSKT